MNLVSQDTTISGLDSGAALEPSIRSDLRPTAPEGDQHLLMALFENFSRHGALSEVRPLKTGHINKTYIGTVPVTDGEPIQMLHQWINHHVFQDVPGLMRNIIAVTEHLNAIPGVSSLKIVTTNDGQPYILDSAGGAWRTYEFIRGTYSLDQCESETVARYSGRALAEFQANLSSFDASQLVETIPFFHDAERRYLALEAALTEDRAARAGLVTSEIQFALSQREALADLIRSLKDGTLPKRVTHNDTKLNNILFSQENGRPVCIVDLDTVMPGSLLFDYGDLLRNIAVQCREDETDLSKVKISLAYFNAASEGYASVMRDVITPDERHFLPQAPILMGQLLGVRFLTDYLNGDTYFRVHYEHHNLDRARCQFAIVRQFQEHQGEIRACLDRIF